MLWYKYIYASGCKLYVALLYILPVTNTLYMYKYTIYDLDFPDSGYSYKPNGTCYKCCQASNINLIIYYNTEAADCRT
jgi:hypothetical protein